MGNEKSEEEQNKPKKYEVVLSNEDVLNQVIAKSNDFIQRTRSSLTLLEQKMLDYMLSKVRPKDEKGKMYFFSYTEFFTAIGRKYDSHSAGGHGAFKRQVKNFADKSFFVDTSDGHYSTLVRMLDIVVVDNVTGGFYYTLHESGRAYILGLIEQQQEKGIYYTTYAFRSTAGMKKKYSSILYNLLKSFSNNSKWKFNIGFSLGEKGEIIFDGIKEINLYYRLSEVRYEKNKEVSEIPMAWKSIGEFKRNVLDPSVVEINKLTDIHIRYELSKISVEGIKSNKTCAIIFYISKNNGNAIEDEEIPEEKKPVRCKYIKIYNIVKEKINESQSDKLFGLIKDRYFADHNVIPEIWAWELWAAEFIKHYYLKLYADDENTKTTFYRRLMDNVFNDYDKFADKVDEKLEYLIMDESDERKFIYNDYDQLSFLDENGQVQEPVETKSPNEDIIDVEYTPVDENKDEKKNIPDDVKKLINSLPEDQRNMILGYMNNYKEE